MNAAPSEHLAAGVIAQLPLFQEVSRAHLDEILRHVRTQFFRRGQVVARRGAPLPGLYAIASGMVKLALRSDTGVERVLRLAGPGQTYGEAVVFLRRPLPLDAVAVVDTGLVLVPAEPLILLTERDARFGHGMVASLAPRMHALVCDFEASTMHGATGRLAAYLGSLAESPEEVCVQLPAAKKLIAGRLGMTKETFSRALRELASAGLVRVAGREVTLLDRAALARTGCR